MEAVLQTYVDRLGELHAGLLKACEGLPQEALDWVPGADMTSLAGLVAHTAGGARGMLCATIAGETIVRDRDSEIGIKGAGYDQLAELLNAALADARRVLDAMSLDDLARPVTLRNGRVTNVAWVLFHALDHAAEHLGHAGITRQLWDQKA
jgi:uncharacterized damage-inducible protein DinB